MAELKALKARQVLDSRGRPTVEVDAVASTGAIGRAIVPSGASTGRHEALELRDAGNPRYGGLGVLMAVENVTREIAQAVAGMDLEDQAGLDARLVAIVVDAVGNQQRGQRAAAGGERLVQRVGAHYLIFILLSARGSETHARPPRS